MCIYIYTCVCAFYVLLYIPGVSKTPKSQVQSRKNIFLEKNVVKKPYLGYCWMCTNLSKSGGLVLYQISASPHVATLYWQHPKHHRNQSKRYHTRCAHSPQTALTSYDANSPFNGTGGSQKVTTWICMAFQKSAYQMWTQKTLAPIICVVFFLPGSGNCGASKLDVAAAHPQRQKHQYFEYGLVWVNYGLNTI